jgi:hypothetical protein
MKELEFLCIRCKLLILLNRDIKFVIIDKRNPYSITFTSSVTSRSALRTFTDYLYERREKVTSISRKKIVKAL